RVRVEVLRAAQDGLDGRRPGRLDLEGVVLAVLRIDVAGRSRQLADREDVDAAIVRGVVIRHEPDHVRVEGMAAARGDRPSADAEGAVRAEIATRRTGRKRSERSVRQ